MKKKLFISSIFVFLCLLWKFAIAADTLKIPRDTTKINFGKAPKASVDLEKSNITPDNQILKVLGEKNIPLQEILQKKVYTKGVAAGEFGGEEKIALQKVTIEKREQKTVSLLKELPEQLQRQIKKEKAENEGIVTEGPGNELLKLELNKPAPQKTPEVITEPTVISPITLVSQEIPVKTAAIKALGEVKEPSVIPILRETITKTPALKHEAAAALAKLGDTSGIKILKEELMTDKLPVKVQAIQTLGEIKEASAIPQLQALLGEGVDSVSTAAAFALAKNGDAKGIDRVKALLQSKDESTRLKAAGTLAEIKDKSAIPVLEAFLKNPRSSVKIEALSALATMGDKSVLPVLEDLMANDPDFRVRLSASESILKLKGSE